MKLGKFREKIKHIPDDWDIDLKDPNYPGVLLGDLFDFSIEEKTKQILIDVPFCEEVD